MHFEASTIPEPQLTTEIKPGNVLADQYRVERVLRNNDGVALLLAGTDLELDRPVTIRVLLPELAASPVAISRFVQEARAAARLTGEHSARIYHIGALETGVPFVVTEALPDRDLGEMLRQRGRLPVSEAVDYVLQAAEGIAEARAYGTTYREVNPRTLLLSRGLDGIARVKLVDLELSAPRAHDDATLTTTTLPLFRAASPDSMRGARTLDLRNDVRALGLTLYELLVGEPPLDAATVPNILVGVLPEGPPPPHTVHLDIPEGLSHVVLRCLEEDTPARFRDIAQLGAALEPFGSVRMGGAGERIRRMLQASEPRIALADPGGIQGSRVLDRQRKTPTTLAAPLLPQVPQATPSRARATLTGLGLMTLGAAAILTTAVLFARNGAARPVMPPEPAKVAVVTAVATSGEVAPAAFGQSTPGQSASSPHGTTIDVPKPLPPSAPPAATTVVTPSRRAPAVRASRPVPAPASARESSQ
jgi:serine/threonine-protein kinase